MMIIKTIIANELPDNCFRCKFSHHNSWGKDWSCILNGSVITDATNMGVKDHNCPITLGEEFVYHHDHVLLTGRLKKRIAELEGKIDQLTAHDATERQDDKSSNDTQTQTIVYGKEDSEVQDV